ncbi:hypothetical protein [Devosia sp. FJ2-5-3]|uniref:SH3 domain-containing protein n=1 Tax=Devosia sp. FJ2-5-3 TaxID=2976680 RepID=UPI0023D7DE37|nr:hypothetical protein [Devosia sp. FJ2-5-3]WEJ59598.1 hypothetical protein N0P34_06120 [Devosia sp. FJ2-5-3]
MRAPAKKTGLALVTSLVASLALALPTQALTVTARVSGGNIAIHSGPGDGYAIIGRVADGMEIPIDRCTQNDSDSRFGSFFGDAGHALRGRNATQWCHIPDTGWVLRSYIVGRGLVNVTPPDFNGPGW